MASGWGSSTLALAAASGALAAWIWSRCRADVSRAPTRARGAVIVVPGGGLTPDGLPTAWVRRRLEEAAKLYNAKRLSGEKVRVVALSGGTPHKPMPIDPKSGFQVYEAEGNARCLIRDFGVPANDVFEENWSLDTIGNAYMLRAVFTDVAGWQRLIIVNNEFHMGRTRAIFDKVFGLLPVPIFGAYNLEYVEVPNDGVEGEALASRKEREAKSTAGFKRNTANLKTLQQMHTFLFSDHLAYASKRLLKDREPVDPKALQTY